MCMMRSRRSMETGTLSEEKKHDPVSSGEDKCFGANGVELGYVKHGRGAWAAQGVLQMLFQRPNRAEFRPMETNGGEG